MAYQDQIDAADAVAPDEDVAEAIGLDERRMHVRAYNYWCSLLDGRDYPSIEDVDPGDVEDFAAHSVLLDYSAGGDDPATPYVGEAIRKECDLEGGIKRISDVPPRSLLSRLTDHYMQIIANRAPVGFEAEFVNQRGHNISYRGILMPLSSDGETIDFIYGVINWKDAGVDQGANVALAPALAPVEEEVEDQPLPPANDEEHLAWEDGPLAEAPLELDEPLEEDFAAPALDQSAGLADWLQAARSSAEVCKAADGRSRAALYDALGLAYDFSVAAERRPEDYQQLLEDAGVKAQARAPMTPIVKLVFGADYDKARLTEFSTALAYAHRTQVEFGQFVSTVEATEGGLKGMVKAERAARRGDQPPVDKAAEARAKMRDAEPLQEADFDGEFALMVARRNPDGSIAMVAILEDEKLVDRALIKAAR
ncbi:PAS domain-containing protein [Sphingomicrobium lutaoense]|uniref:PAS domain-containing protein n=1 Tax=Sphingomicrobium lutaoense TaxID=515949 RepID=A0A839Z1V5_9SPHN|nr:hypothetical protein [Sphingomicrobium lutaoense]MBB3764548.1 hypothetical protein [Sphingomicrobium lutaoense]